MDYRIAEIKTPEGCEQFAINVEERGMPDLARQARRRAVELRAAAHGATSDAEREALEAVYAYERAQTMVRGKTFHASRTWQMIERLGIIDAVERAVKRDADSMGFEALVKMGMQDKAFEAVVLRYPGTFSAEAVRRSRERLATWGGPDRERGNKV